jgi:hypothetical protein
MTVNSRVLGLKIRSFAAILAWTTGVAGLSGCGDGLDQTPLAPPNPVLFVTQTPFHTTFDMVTGTFGNHKGGESYAPRGGDLRIVYASGNVRNLTEEAGFGLEKHAEIAVREPSVHWDGKRALFSMVIGGTVKDVFDPVYWQIYEVTGLGEGEAVHIERVPNQPEKFNNVSPVYGSDGRILFTTDMPRNGDRLLYPQLDEYESVETNTGLWSFDPALEGGDARILTHVPSGVFSPKVALDGRVIYVRWDHLQRDQQAHAEKNGDGDYGTFDFASESSADHASSLREMFPEPEGDDEVSAGNHRHTFNQFFPWQINPDGTEEETVNHVGRHEMVGYIESTRDDLPYHSSSEEHPPITNFFHIAEDPGQPGMFYGTNAPEFATHSSGEIVAFNGKLGVNADDIYPIHITNPATYQAPEWGTSDVPGADGRYRNPVPLADGTLIAVHTPDAHQESTAGNGPFGNASYRFRIRHLIPQEGSQYLTAGSPLAEPITKTVTYFDNQSYGDVTYSGEMWELDPVEVVARPQPASRSFEVPAGERAIIDDVMMTQGGYDGLRAYLEKNGLALLISRNVTRRADEQQPYNLAIPGGTATVAPGEKPEDIEYIQFYQGDQLRGYSGHRDGRRVLAREMHDAPDAGLPFKGAFKLGLDGSFAALVPARRAMSWQLDAPDGTAVVRERYWLTFAPGEIRVCPNCHGVNRKDVVMGEPAPENAPEALAPLLQSLFE